MASQQAGQRYCIFLSKSLDSCKQHLTVSLLSQLSCSHRFCTQKKNKRWPNSNMQLPQAVYSSLMCVCEESKRSFVPRVHAHSLTHTHRLLKFFEAQVSNRSH